MNWLSRVRIGLGIGNGLRPQRRVVEHSASNSGSTLFASAAQGWRPAPEVCTEFDLRPKILGDRLGNPDVVAVELAVGRGELPTADCR